MKTSELTNIKDLSKNAPMTFLKVLAELNGGNQKTAAYGHFGRELVIKYGVKLQERENAGLEQNVSPVPALTLRLWPVAWTSAGGSA